MERLTKKLIQAIPARYVLEINLKVDTVPSGPEYSFLPRARSPGVIYTCKISARENLTGGIVCSRGFFSGSYTKARIVASEAKTYFENLGAKVTLDMNKTLV